MRAALAQTSAAAPDAQFAYEVAKEAYVYAYPLMLTDATLRQLTNFAEQPPGVATAHGPANRFNHAREFPDASSKVVVRTNVDGAFYFTRSVAPMPSITLRVKRMRLRTPSGVA